MWRSHALFGRGLCGVVRLGLREDNNYDDDIIGVYLLFQSVIAVIAIGHRHRHGRHRHHRHRSSSSVMCLAILLVRFGSLIRRADETVTKTEAEV